MTLQLATQYDSVAGNFERYGATRKVEGAYADDWQTQLLRTVLAGSAGAVVLVAGYVPQLPHFGTSPSIVDNRSLSRVALLSTTVEPAKDSHKEPPNWRDMLAMPFADQAKTVLSILSLNKSQLADLLGVSRPTIYDWLEGKEPNAVNAQRVANVLRLLATAGVTVSSPLNARFVRQPLGERGLTLIDALSSATLDEDSILALVQEVKTFGNSAESRRRSREERLRALGFEEPSAEQRKEQLAQNIAMRDWPKT